MSGRYLNLVGDNRPVTGASAPAGDPPSSAGAMLFDVDAHEVDPGDILVDAPHARVAHMLFSGCEWIYFDARRRPITSYALDARVLVVRKGVSGESAIGNDAAAWELGVFSSSDTQVSPLGRPATNPHAVNAGAVEDREPPVPALTPHGEASGKVGRHESRSTVDPCEGLGSVVAQGGDSSACHPNTRPDNDAIIYQHNDECAPFGIERPRARLITPVPHYLHVVTP